MLGAIIGDLAAYTWQHNKDVFYKKLIADDAQLSEYGATIIALAKPIYQKEKIGFDTIEKQLFDYLRNEHDIAEDVREWMKSYKSNMSFNKVRLIVNMMNALAGWCGESADEAQKTSDALFHSFLLEKEDFYASLSLPILIWNLRQGLTKDEAIQGLIGHVGDTIIEWKYKNTDSPLSAIARAWDAFYRSYDFTSAIHSAVKSPINPRLTAAITGTLAEAMYGCEYGFLKKKYQNNIRSFEIKPPLHIENKYRDELYFIRKNTLVSFFPKNKAMTNVERHHWTNAKSKYKNMMMDNAYYQLLKKAFYTDWDNRYGFYLDDGWFYVYRSYVLICRFRVIKKSEDSFYIEQIQKGDEDNIYEIALEEAFHSLDVLNKRSLRE